MRFGVTSAPTARKSDYNICGGGIWVRGGCGGDCLRRDRRAIARYSSVHLLLATYENTYMYYLQRKIRKGEHFIIRIAYAYKSIPYTGLVRPLRLQEVESPRI